MSAEAARPGDRPPLTRRERIFARDHYRCVYCNAAPPMHELTLDHVEPRVKGGDQSDGNLVTCCKACNELKAGKPAWAFLAREPERRENFLQNAAHVWPRIKRAVAEAAEKQTAQRILRNE